MTGPPSFSSFPVIALKPSSISFSTRPQLVDEEDKRGEYSQSRTISSRQQGSERKEAKRRRDRERAAALVKGEKRNIGHEGGVDKGNLASKRLDRRIEVDDDVPWYEASGEGKVLLGYEEDFESTAPKAFFSDTAGDKDAIKFCISSSHSVPKYHRDGRGKILGVSEGLRVVHSVDRTQRGLELAPLGKTYIPRYSARPLEAASDRHRRRLLIRPDDEDTSFDPRSSFVAFDIRPRRPLDTSETPTYRNISRVDEKDDDEEADVLDTALSRFWTLEEDLRRRTTEMARHLQQHPDDVETWITYSTIHLKLSPELASGQNAGVINPAKPPQTRANAEVTLSILARALDAHEQNTASPRLHIAYVHAAETIWPPEKVTERWKNVLRELSGRRGRQVEEGIMAVWLGYIEWREGQGFGKSADGREGLGGVEEVVDVYVGCLASLGNSKRSGDQQAVEENQVYLLLRACLFLRQAGYTERALSIFQALIEITFFKPDDLRPQRGAGQEWFERVLTRFEDFWDAESLRIGETGARGWRDSSVAPAVRISQAMSCATPSLEDSFERWLQAERHADRLCAMPGRATDLGLDSEDDPYRVILFSDIRPFLFPVQAPEVRLQLIYAFLNFLGLPFTPPDVPTTTPAAADPHLQWTLAYNDALRSAFWPFRANTKQLVWQTVGGEPMEPEHSRPLQNPFSCPIKSWPQERSTMFSDSGRWFRDLENADLQHVDVSLVKNVFSLLRPLVPDPAFTLASFAFEAAVAPKSAVKMAKSILSADRNNLVLWDGYARLERQRGNTDAARAVYVAALQAAQVKRDPASNIAGETSADEDELWSAWSEMEWEEGNESRCVEVLVMATGMELSKLERCLDPSYAAASPSAIAVLRSRQFYESLRPPHSPAKLLMTGLFAYLVNDIDAARKVIHRHMDLLPVETCAMEEAYQFLCKLLYVHCSRHAAPASLARETLEIAISSYPDNTLLLSLYLWGEMGGRVYGRVQSLVSKLSSASGDGAGVIGHLWSVWAEAMSAHRTFWDKGGGGAERVRNALDRGINSILGKQSAPMWKLYIEFETLMGRTSVAKQLSYRAVSAIGGCKDLYLLPFIHALRPSFTPRELRDWAELMTERGIRIRVPFEQFWDPNEEDEAMELPEDEEPDEDELGFLSERQRLKPY